ncbi:MAG: VOC family protein [Granulosicoccus sp.]|nr:VOC family protein [Granulosicoccus sp.]
MQLGAFSVSLAVQDLERSRLFYEQLGFLPFAGDADQGWLMLRNGEHVLGLFQGMFERNILTFNPGWNQQCEDLDSFTDVRQLQSMLREKGAELASVAEESTSGPASISLIDPDGNQILIDQHR